MSRRLRSFLREHWIRQGQLTDDRLILRGLGKDNCRRRHFRRACLEAGLGHRRPKDLRDTYALQLPTAGVQLGFISAQLGHSNVAVTTGPYARSPRGQWLPGTDRAATSEKCQRISWPV